MDQMDSSTANRTRQFFKNFNRYMVWFWRLGFRRYVNCWPRPGGRVMVVTHTGRKSGSRYRTPLNYAVENGEIYCMAGFGHQADWFRNIQANPQVEIWLPDSWWSGQAEDMSQDQRRLPLLRRVLMDTGIVGPLFGMDPRKLNDADLDRALGDSRLVHIHRLDRLSGPGGPGDLAWIWVPLLAAMVLLYCALRFWL